MMLISIAVPLCLSVFVVRLQTTDAVECSGRAIQYVPYGLLRMKNCTSILGSLTVASVYDFNNINETNKYQLSNLKEITGFLVLFDLQGLKSPGHLFPNLTVIRGKHLAMSYALILFNNPHMQTIDFTSLISIQRGYVLIENCPSLCFYKTVNWAAITDEDEDDFMAGKGNRIQTISNSTCPTTESCRACEPRNCWSASECQKTKESVNHIMPVDGLDCHKSCPGQCVNKTVEGCVKGMKCHELCLGGCVNATAEGCNVCSKLKWKGKCVTECPSDLFVFRDTMRCISKEVCTMVFNMIPFDGECRKQCPVQYSQYHPDTNEYHKSDCFKCKIKCPHRCGGAEIRGPTDLEYFRECAIVDGSLSISLGQNMTDIYEKLEENLGNIETINGVLKIYRSFTLTSLSFFRSLTKIEALNATVRAKGIGDDQTEFWSPYALEITENDNLQTLFDWREKHQLEIIGGGMLFHLNAKLCMKEIHNLQNITIYDPKNDRIHNETNGYDEVCHATGIYAFDVVQSHSAVGIYWNISDFGVDKKLIGYFVYYIEAPSHNITYFSGLDACSTKRIRTSPSKYTDLPMISKHHNSDVWQSIFVPFEDLQKEQQHFRTNLTGLKQNTQYAYYVRTQLSLKVRDQLINVTQGQSPMKYFTTFPDRPRPPMVRTTEKSNVSVTLEWYPSTPEHELVEKYVIDVYAIVDDANGIDNRNYCHHPKVEKKPDISVAPEVICCRDQRAYLEFFQRENNQTCGDSDQRCEKAFEFVLFHHHVENALLMADLEKDPSERYQPKIEPYESPIHYRGTVDPIQRKRGTDRSSQNYLHSHIIDDNRTSSVQVPNLKPFQVYAFYVYACNKVADCSDYYFHSDRTEPSPDSNDLALTAIPDERRNDIVTLIIQPPTEPNSIIVAYEVESYDYSRTIVNVKCITRKNMEDMNYTLRYENLLVGSHSFRVRRLSIVDDGDFGDWVWIDVDESDHTYNWGIGLAFIAIIAIIIITLIYRKFKSCQTYRVGDADPLLIERRDSDEDTLATQSKPPQSQQLPSPAWQESQSPPVPSERVFNDDIQMTVFKSNLTDQQPSTSDDPTTPTPGPSSPSPGPSSPSRGTSSSSPRPSSQKSPTRTPVKGTAETDDTEAASLLSKTSDDSPWTEDDPNFSLFDI